MKRHLLSVIMCAACVCGITAQEENPGGWDFNIPFVNTHSSSSSSAASAGSSSSSTSGTSSIELSVIQLGRDEYSHPKYCSFGLGWIAGTGQADGVKIDMGQSYELELRNILCVDSHLGNRTWLSIGLGIDWRNYRMTGRNRFVKLDNGDLAVGPYPDGAEPKFSRIHTFSLCVPVQMHWALGRNCHLSVGPEVYFNTYASLKTRYRLDGEKRKEKAKGLHRNGVTVGLGCDISVYGFGIYYKYNPCHVLKSDFAPEFGSMTVGLRLKL